MWRTPLPSNSRERVQPQLQTITGSSEYIGPADIASPTLPASAQNNGITHGSVTLMEQPVFELNPQPVTTDNPQITQIQMATENRTSPTHSIAAAGNNPGSKRLSSQQHCDMTPTSHGVITTPSGLTAIITTPTPTATIATIDSYNIIPSQTSPGYVEHRVINVTHL